MKKDNAVRWLAYVLVVAIPFWFGSCKKGGDVVTPSGSSIEGSWKIAGYKVNPGVDFTGTGQKSNDLFAVFKQLPSGADVVDCLTSTVITFNNNGKITGKAGAKCTAATDMNPVDDNSTWKLDGNKLTITSGTEVTTYDTVISGSSLKMAFQQAQDLDGDGKPETYTYTLELTKA